MTTPKEKVLSITSPLGGWGRDLSQSNSASFDAGVDRADRPRYAKSTAVSMHRPGLIGNIAPGETFTKLTDATPKVTALALNGDVDSSGNFWVALRNCRLIKVVSDAVSANYDATAGAPNHAGHVVATSDHQDVTTLRDSAGTERVIMSWEDDVDADILRINTDGSGQDDDWFSTLSGSAVLTKSVPHVFARGGINSHIYCTNGQYIAVIDLAASTGTTQGLNLGTGWIATSAVRFGNYVAIVGYQATAYLTSFTLGKVRVWLWNGSYPDPNFIYDIEDNYATKIENDNGVLKVFTQGRSGTTKAWKFNGSAFETFFESQQIGNAPRHGGASLYQSMLHFVTTSGNLVLGALDGDAFHYRASPIDSSQASPTGLGMCRELYPNVLYVGYQRGGPAEYGIYRIDHAGYFPGAQFRTGLNRMPFRSRVLWFRIYFSQFGSGASIQLALMRGQATASFGGASDLLNRTLTYSTLGAVNEFFFRQEIDDLSNFYMAWKWNHSQTSDTAAIVQRLDIGYRSVSGRN